MRKWKNTLAIGAIVLATALSPIGCGAGKNETANLRPGEKASAEPSASLPEGLFLREAPESPTDVGEALKTAQEGDSIAIRGRIGGVKEPFTKNRAIFVLCDNKLQACSEHHMDGCPTPWDMCCAQDRLDNLASIQISDADGRPLKFELKGRDEFRPLNVLVIKGRVGPRPDPKTLLIHADGIFVEKME
jgi:hypothetical protein